MPSDLRSPIAPAVGRLDGRLELFPGQLGLALALEFQVIQELQEHDPSEHRQPVEVAIEPFVLPHDVPRGFEESAEGLGGGGWGNSFCHWDRRSHAARASPPASGRRRPAARWFCSSRHRDGAELRSWGRLRSHGRYSIGQRLWVSVLSPGVDGIRGRVMAAAVQTNQVPNQMLVRFAFPKGTTFCGSSILIWCERVGFPTVQDVAQAVPWHRPDDDVRVVGHHDPRVQLVAPTPQRNESRPGDKVAASPGSRR